MNMESRALFEYIRVILGLKDYAKLAIASVGGIYHNERKGYFLYGNDDGITPEAEKYGLHHDIFSNRICKRSSDLSGQVFGKVTVIRLAEEHNANRTRKPYIWECRCECGNIVYKYTDTLKNKDVTMCAECADRVHVEKARASAGYVGGTQLTKIRSEKLNKANTSGVKGVSLDKRSGKWRAHIGFKGQKIKLGYFSDFEEAVKARQRAEEEYFGEFLEEQVRPE